MPRLINIFFAALLALVAGAEAQDSNIRDQQYTEYLLGADFNGDRVQAACQPNSGIGVTFAASADEPNLRPFLDFLKIRPARLSDYNRGQFSQVATALGYGVEDVCEEMMRVGGKNANEAIGTDYDPVVDVVNLSEFRFEYMFKHDHPEGSLPLERRAFPIVELDVKYRNDNFPDEAGDIWIYQTVELIVTVNNYSFFAWPGPREPGTLRLIDGSYPCYYKHPTLRAVYRLPWHLCNPGTYVEDAPRGVSLMEAVRLLTVDFIEQNIDTAAPEKLAPIDEPVEVCCRVRGAIFGATNYFAPAGECRDSGNGRRSVVSARYCEAPEPERLEAEPPRYDPTDRGGDVCCRNYSDTSAPDIFASRRWCEDRDNHDIVPDYFCRDQRRDAIVCCEDGRGISPEVFETTEAICLARDRHRVLYGGICVN